MKDIKSGLLVLGVLLVMVLVWQHGIGKMKLPDRIHYGFTFPR